jgi:glycosyltransferase involved in cell wall biosynthesis
LRDKNIYFLTIGATGYSRSWNILEGLRKLGICAEFIQIDSRKLIKVFWTIRNKTSKSDVFVIMSPSHYLVPFARIFLGNNIYLDAGWSLFEASIISRRQVGFMGINILKCYFIDFTANHFAKKVILESNSQKNFYCKFFLLRKKKCSVIYSGVDEEQFKLNLEFETPIDIFKNSRIVLFRGKYSPEAGLEVLADATRLLNKEEITFWVYSPGVPSNLEFSANTIIINNFVESKQDLTKVYSEASLTLGQLSNHSRLKRTIPHKAYESAFLSKPYLCARTRGILELFIEDKDIFCFNPGDAVDLANKIKIFFASPDNINKIGIKMREKYDSESSQYQLGSRFLNIIESTE